MPQFHPENPPDFLAEPNRDAERQVWEVLQRLDASWPVFYSARDNSKSGYDREIDFVLIWYNRIFYLEVKGGLVVVDRRAGAGVTWAHYTRSGELIEKRADPKQLWRAKAALGKTIRQITGKSPRHIGFVEHDFYVFPHTPHASVPEQDLERTNVHYAFAEEIDYLPDRLLQIVRSEKGVFIQPEWIDGVIRSLSTLVIGGGGSLPQQSWTGTIKLSARRQSRPQLQAAEPVQVSWPVRKSVWTGWRLFFYFSTAAGLCVFLFAMLPGDIVRRLPGIEYLSAMQKEVVPVVRRPPPPPGSKPTPARREAELPPFIPRSAATEVEQTIAMAQKQSTTLAHNEAVPLLWQSGVWHGFVTLQVDEGNGCRRYRISRNDLQPTAYQFIRRCS